MGKLTRAVRAIAITAAIWLSINVGSILIMFVLFNSFAVLTLNSAAFVSIVEVAQSADLLIAIILPISLMASPALYISFFGVEGG